MIKGVLILVLVSAVLVSSTSVMEKLKEDIAATQISGSSATFSSAFSSGSSSLDGAAIPATRLESEGSSGSSASLSSGSSGCSDPDPCKNPISFGQGAGAGQGAPQASVDDALKPVDDWIKDFRKRTMGDGSDLYAAAKATVKPLITKLRRTQQRAEERLAESNRAILRHVEEQTTQHIYALLKADRMKTQEEERKEEQAAKILDAKAAEKEAKETLNAQLGMNSEQAAAVDSALKSKGVMPSQSVLDSIAKLLSSESTSAQSAISSALKKASSESSFSSGSSKSGSSSGSSSSSGSGSGSSSGSK